MKNPAQALLSRCNVGFYLWQKLALTGLTVLYVLSPVDPVPDPIIILGQLDDVYVIYLLIRVWRSPTLPAPDGGAAELDASSYRQAVPVRHAHIPVVHREKVGGVS
jgi:hypothetical protein